MPAPWCKSPEIALQKENISYTGGTFDARYSCLGTYLLRELIAYFVNLPLPFGPHSDTCIPRSRYDNQTGQCAKGDAWCWQGTHPAGGSECCDCNGTCLTAKEELAFPSPFPTQAIENRKQQAICRCL